MKFRSAGVLFVELALLGLTGCGTRLPDSAFQNSSSQRVSTGGNNNDNSGDLSGNGDSTDTTLLADAGGGSGISGNGSTGPGTKTGTGGPTDSGANKASEVGV